MDILCPAPDQVFEYATAFDIQQFLTDGYEKWAFVPCPWPSVLFEYATAPCNIDNNIHVYYNGRRPIT